MAEQDDVDIEALSEDEVVDLTVDDNDDWDEIEVDSLYNLGNRLCCKRDCARGAAACAGFQRS